MPKPTTTKPTGLLSKLRVQNEDSRPEGWKTMQELLAEDPMAKTTARGILNKAIADGTVETRKFKSPIGGGRFAIRLNYKEK